MTESAIVKVHVFTGEDGQGYYTAAYANGEPGPRSEGYAGGEDDAERAARRDFPGLPIERGNP